jgi:hypothetical protein
MVEKSDKMVWFLPPLLVGGLRACLPLVLRGG